MTRRAPAACAALAAATFVWWLIASRSSLQLIPYAIQPAVLGATFMASPGVYAMWLAKSDPRARSRVALLATAAFAVFVIGCTIAEVRDAVVYVIGLTAAWGVLVTLHATTGAPHASVWPPVD
jgi:hypothetical protein